MFKDMGNNLASSACVNGQAECFNCCVQHDVPVNQMNYADETPLDIARKSGKSQLIEKAGKTLIKKWKFSFFSLCNVFLKFSQEPNKMSVLC
jgi:hypothetical protein